MSKTGAKKLSSIELQWKPYLIDMDKYILISTY